MRRYNFLPKDEVYEALNRLRDAFLAAKNGHDVDEIMNGVMTEDERIRIGRRIVIAEGLKHNWTYEETVKVSNVGYSTIAWVAKQMTSFPRCFALLFERHKKLEKEYQSKRMKSIKPLSPLPNIPKVYSGIKRSDIKR